MAFTKANPPKAKIEQYWKSIWEKEASHNTNASWLVDLSHPQQEPATIVVPDIKERISSLNVVQKSESQVTGQSSLCQLSGMSLWYGPFHLKVQKDYLLEGKYLTSPQ